MSYILDALNKSERERRSGTIEVLETVSERDDGVPGAGWRYGLLVALLLILLVLVAALAWHFRGVFQNHGDRPDMVKETVSAMPSSGVPGEPVTQSAVVAGGVFDSTRILTESIEADSASAGSARYPGTAAGGVDSGIVPDTVAENRSAVSLAELDRDAAASLPAITINVLTYSEDPARRFVMINGRFAREGEALGEGLLVERIHANRVELSRGPILFYVEPH